MSPSSPLIDGKYRIVSELARGGMGVVYRAREEATGREVALKMILNATERARERLLREGRHTAALDHENIVRVHACGEFEGRPYLAYELVVGCRSMGEVFREVPLDARIALVREAASALGYTHAQGVVHRDVKPANLLVDHEGRVRVADFGLAVASEDGRLTRTGELVGTPSYMAPEQFDGQAGCGTSATDVWALGVILYEALTGLLPFPGPRLVDLAAQIGAARPRRPRAVDPTVSPALEAVCLCALSRQPEDRYPDGAAFAAALEYALSATASRPPGWAAVLGACAIGAAAAAGVFFLRGAEGEPTPEPSSTLVAQVPTPSPTLPATPARPLGTIVSLVDPAERLKGLEEWLGANAASPRRGEVEGHVRRLRFEVPLAAVSSPGARITVGQFLDEDRFFTSGRVSDLTVWRFEDGSVRQEGVVPLPPGVVLVDGPARSVCDLVRRVDGAVWLLRNRSLDALLASDAALAPHPTADLRLAFMPRVAVVQPGQDGRSTYAFVEAAGGSSVLHVLTHAPGEREASEVLSHTVEGTKPDLLALSPAGDRVALTVITDDDESLVVLDVTARRRLWRRRVPDDLTDLAFAPGSGHLVAPTAAGAVLSYDLPGEGAARILRSQQFASRVLNYSHGSCARAGIYSRDGRLLLTCSSAGSKDHDLNELRGWDPETGAELPEWRIVGMAVAPRWLALSPSGRRFLLGASDRFELRRLPLPDKP